MKLLLFAALAFSILPVCAQPQTPPIAPKTLEEQQKLDDANLMVQAMLREADTPLHAVRTFAEAYNRNDVETMARLVMGADPHDAALPALRNHLIAARGTFDLLFFKDENVVEIGDKATVKITFTTRNHLGLKMQMPEVLSLQIESTNLGKFWRLIPPKPTMEYVADVGKNDFLRRVSAYVAHPATMLMLLRAHQSLEQAKIIGLGLNQFLLDFNGKYDLTPETLVAKLQPYLTLESKDIFTAPGDAPGTQSYSINPNLAGRTLEKNEGSAKLVAIYLGRDGKLDFRFDGKAVVGFADGHVALVDKMQAGNLRWKP